MSFTKEFKEFALKGNVVDMAIGVIIGAAFGKIVSSMVADVFTPILGRLIGNVDFSSLFWALSGDQRPASLAQAKELGVATLNYGVFLQSVFDFLIIALLLFMVIKMINRLKRQEPAAATAAPATKACPECLSTIPLAARRCSQCTSVVTA
jgi:large conductance mechanosensitive channel